MKIAAETVEILDRGSYRDESGATVSISAALDKAKGGALLYTPELVAGLHSPPPTEKQRRPTALTVENCTTFAAARALADDGADPLCLNFASAKNPGGGFISGSQAQEECLARASGLYACLVQKTAYYESNRACATSLYTDHIIYSPGVPVFRDDADRLLSEPYLVSIVTAPAVNAGAVKSNEPENVGRIAPTMRRRIRGVLAIARHQGHHDLVLGAWGCGVFGNDPSDVADWFREALTEDAAFSNVFRRVVFAVLHRTEGQSTFRAFQERLGTYSAPGVSESAKRFRETGDSHRDHLEQSATLQRRELLNELEEIREECREDGWDGHGARAMSQDALRQAYLLIESLPADFPTPSLGAEPDGHVSFEWLSGPDRVLSVSAGDPGELHYAAKIGPRPTRGTEAFVGEFPPRLASLVRRVFYR